MITEARKAEIKQWLLGLDKEELAWANGFSEGLVITDRSSADTEPAAIAQPSVPKKITIAYGTETGNSKKLATAFAAKAKQNAIGVKLVGLDQYKHTDFAKEEYFFLVVSTHGEGEPPAAAKKFHELFLNDKPTNTKLKFAVLALGDTSYPLFCQTGIDFDRGFEAAGGKRLLPLEKCDLDYEDKAEKWFGQALHSLNKSEHEAHVEQAAAVQAVVKKTVGKKNYLGTVTANINLNGRGSTRETHHLEIAVDSVDYLPGDSIGIVPANPKEDVAAILEILGEDGERQVPFRKESASLRDVLENKANIGYLMENTMKKYAAIIGSSAVPKKQSLLDLLRNAPLPDKAKFDEVIGILNPVSPRLYTLASSPLAHPGEVHITVLKEKFLADGTEKSGICSSFLSVFPVGGQLPFFVQPNRRFRLPESHKDIIMIGPGTGIAPFRSFVAERDATGATGRNWLFFGEQRFVSDFLYQTEWQTYHATGSLHKISLAFSADHAEKKYVEHKMLEQSRELFEWIKGGAHVYICGNKEKMGPAVETALLQVIGDQANLSPEDTIKYLHGLEEEGRYEKDLY